MRTKERRSKLFFAMMLVGILLLCAVATVIIRPVFAESGNNMEWKSIALKCA